MRLKVGFNFTIRFDRDEDPYRETDVQSLVERSPETDEWIDSADRVAPRSNSVLGFRSEPGGT